jgi:uncharacterized heparinase superfamily protein
MKCKELAPLFFSIFFAKPVQLYGRLIFMLKRRFLRVTDSKSHAKRAQQILSALQPPDEIRFIILNSEAVYRWDELIWYDRSREKLWRYTLNYFYWLDRRPFSEGAALILHWIAHNNDERSEPWEPAVSSHRISTWISWAEKHRDSMDEIPGFGELLADSLMAQLSRLAVDLEHHVQANHLLDNYKALLTGSVYLSRRWKKDTDCHITEAARGFMAQLDEQILPDGGHYERSPMYHCLAMQAVKEVLFWAAQGLEKEHPGTVLTMHQCSHGGLAEKELKLLSRRCAELLSKIENWRILMTHPDGLIALFGDSAFNAFPFPAEKMSGEAGDGVHHLTDSGYLIKRWGEGNYFVMKLCGPTPAWQPGHSHCDALSFELSLSGERVVVDSGCGSYQNPEIRRRCRGTEAHNVSWVEGSGQSEFAGEFRFGRRAAVRKCDVVVEGNSTFMSAEIEDYKGNVIKRKVTLSTESLHVEDRLLKRRLRGKFVSLIHLGPSVEIAGEKDGRFQLAGKNVRFVLSSESAPEARPSLYYPEFGLELKNQCIALSGGDNAVIEYNIAFQETP